MSTSSSSETFVDRGPRRPPLVRGGVDDRRQVFPAEREIAQRAVEIGARPRPQREVDALGQLGQREPAVREVASKRRGSLFPVTISDEHGRYGS